MIVRLDAATACPLQLLEPDDCSRLHISVDAGCGVDILEGAGLGWIHDGRDAAVDPLMLQFLALGRVPADWPARFRSMIEYAGSKGWVTGDGRLVAHLVFE